jgi:isopentenyldiphosphate isomerase
LKQIIVDKNDEVIGYKERDKLLPGDIYRVSALWVTNSQWEILIAQRAWTKKSRPGYWWPAVAGTVEEWETYEQNIYKEAQEEIGLTEYIFETVGKEYRKWEKNDYFCQWYRCVCDETIDYFEIQQEEVADIRWVWADSLRREIQQFPERFLLSMQEWAIWKTCYR